MAGFIEISRVHDVAFAEAGALHRLQGKPLLAAIGPESTTVKIPADWRLEEAGGQGWIVWGEDSDRVLMLNLRHVIMVEEPRS